MAPPLTPTFEETQIPADAFNPFNPFNQIISGGSRARILEFGNRFFDNTTDSFLVTLGARGDKLFDGTWGYDMGFRYSNVKATSIGTLVSTSRFNQILNQNDPIFAEGGYLRERVPSIPSEMRWGPRFQLTRLRPNSPPFTRKKSTRLRWGHSI